MPQRHQRDAERRSRYPFSGESRIAGDITSLNREFDFAVTFDGDVEVVPLAIAVIVGDDIKFIWPSFRDSKAIWVGGRVDVVNNGGSI